MLVTRNTLAQTDDVRGPEATNKQWVSGNGTDSAGARFLKSAAATSLAALVVGEVRAMPAPKLARGAPPRMSRVGDLVTGPKPKSSRPIGLWLGLHAPM